MASDGTAWVFKSDYDLDLLFPVELQLSAALKTSFPYDENLNPASAATTCPPPLSPLLLQLLQLLQLTHRHSPALGSVLQLCCSVAGRYVGWMDLLLPARSAAAAETRDRSNDDNTSSPNLLQLLGSTWISSGYSDAAAAIVVFIHRKMEPAARLDLLCRMEVSSSSRSGSNDRCSSIIRLDLCCSYCRYGSTLLP